MPTLQELREQRETKRGELQGLQDALKDRRSQGKSGAELWSEDETKKFDALTGELSTLDADIEAEQRSVDLEQTLARNAEQRGRQTRNGRTDPALRDEIPGNAAGAEYGDVFGDRDQARQYALTEERRSYALHAWACKGRADDLITDNHRQACTDLKADIGSGGVSLEGHGNQVVAGLREIIAGNNTAESRSKAYSHLRESRSLGYEAKKDDWIPTQFRDAFEIAFHGTGSVLPICDLMITDTADSLPWPFADDYGNEGHLVDETVDEDTDGQDAEMIVPKLGALDFTSGFARIAKALLANSPFDLAEILGRVLGERLAKAMERQLALGTRANDSFGGYLDRSVQGAEVPIAAPVSLPKMQELIWSLIHEHRTAGTLVMHDMTLAKFAALVDGENRPLLSIGNDRLQIAKDVSVPYRVCNVLPAPNSSGAITAGQKPILFGNFKQMKVRIVRAVRLERMTEIFAERHQTGFIANRSADADMLRGTATQNAPVKHIVGV